jgi:PAS domain S-box-containing protein
MSDDSPQNQHASQGSNAADDALLKRLAELEATLDAIRAGRVDALVVDGIDGEQVYTLESPDLPYRRFLEQMAEGAVSLDASSTILFCNRFFAELVGRRREELIGSSFADLIAKENIVGYRAALRADHAQHFGSALWVAPGRGSNGHALPVQLAITPVGSGPARRFTVVITDLSERDRLSAAREAVESESLAKDRFLAALAHELRGPLHVIMGWSAFLLEQSAELEPSARKAIETIDRNAKLQRRLIEDMLDVARISSGKLRLNQVPLDLGALVSVTGEAMARAAHEKGIALELNVAETAIVRCDAQRIEQMLQNLVGNAIKFTPEGGKVKLFLEASAGVARLVVSDDGRGIEPALLSQIFQPFRQGLPQNVDQRDSGLGLGLAITKQIATLHGGHVRVHSEGLGHGATFVVELPLHEEQASPAGEGTSHSSSPISLAGARILVADDEEDARELTARMLLRGGAEVVCVSGAEAALARLETQPFDAIVSDLIMPGIDGWDFVDAVRKRHGSALPIVALSGVVGVGHRPRTATAGFFALLKKPVDEQELLSALARAIMRR